MRVEIKIILILIGLIIDVLGAEFGLRIFYPQKTGSIEFSYDPERGAIAVPNQCGRTDWPGVYFYRRCNNSLGLRGTKEYDFEKNSFRILLLGDSFTYGTGVNDDQTFASVLQKRLDEKGKLTEIINAGDVGTGTDYDLKFFQVLGYRYQPDITAVFFYQNDYEDNAGQTYFFEDISGNLVPKNLNGILATHKTIFDNKLYE